MNIFTVTVLY